MSNFKLGQKVTLKQEMPVWYTISGEIRTNGLAFGVVFIISEIVPSRWFPQTTMLGFVGNDALWEADRFAPVVERKTDAGMAILNKILIDAENFKVVEDA